MTTPTTPIIMKPTVGRKVWYRPSANDVLGPFPMAASRAPGAQPLDATIIYVHGDKMINALVTDGNGKQYSVLSCDLLQEGDEPRKDRDGNIAGRYCEWMPYQAGQAKKQAEPLTLPVVETKFYTDGASATGTGPLPDLSPSQQMAAQQMGQMPSLTDSGLLKFGQALELLKNGVSIARIHWGDAGQRLSYSTGIQGDATPHIRRVHANGQSAYWNGSSVDLLAEDWLVVE